MKCGPGERIIRKIKKHYTGLRKKGLSYKQ